MTLTAAKKKEIIEIATLWGKRSYTQAFQQPYTLYCIVSDVTMGVA